ncbi:MAG: DUF3109 family protein [Candidatus Kapabacteria bacterium]|nr:DUF3109 family protein [Candidatus Kapabacteria bacterium]
MILLDDLLIQEQVLTATFACDLQRCKGACCTLSGGAGAPLLENEVKPLRLAVDTALPYLDERSRKWLADNDPVEGHHGDRSVGCIDDAACVFVYYDNTVAKCALERAFHNGESAFRKPISCHLFPIRVANFGGPYLHYEQIEECEPGREHGARLGVPLVDALKDALTRAYGERTYERMSAAARGEEEGDL